MYTPSFFHICDTSSYLRAALRVSVSFSLGLPLVCRTASDSRGLISISPFALECLLAVALASVPLNPLDMSGPCHGSAAAPLSVVDLEGPGYRGQTSRPQRPLRGSWASVSAASRCPTPGLKPICFTRRRVNTLGGASIQHCRSFPTRIIPRQRYFVLPGHMFLGPGINCRNCSGFLRNCCVKNGKKEPAAQRFTLKWPSPAALPLLYWLSSPHCDVHPRPAPAATVRQESVLVACAPAERRLRPPFNRRTDLLARVTPRPARVC